MIGRNDENALTDIDERIGAMERRLHNAKSARDTYLNYLRSKYPMWRPSLSTYKFENNANETLVNRLSTSVYQWDTNVDDGKQLRTRQLQSPKLYSQIPSNGLLLHGELNRARRRLEEIGGQLRVMRETRMSLSTEEFLRSSALIRAPPQRMQILVDSGGNELANIRQRLSEIDVSPFEIPQSPTAEQLEDEKMQIEREKLIADIRAGRHRQPAEQQLGQSMLNDLATISYVASNVQSAPLTAAVPVANYPVIAQLTPAAVHSQSGPTEKIEGQIPASYLQNRQNESEKKRNEAQEKTKPAIGITAKSHEVPPIETKPSSYSQMLNLLSQHKTDDSSSDSDGTPQAKLATFKQPAAAQRKDASKPQAQGLLSQYLTRKDSSVDEFSTFNATKAAPQRKISTAKPSMTQAFMSNDSDDDFFS